MFPLTEYQKAINLEIKTDERKVLKVLTSGADC